MDAAGFYKKPFEEMSQNEKQSQLHFNDIRRSATRIRDRYLPRTAALSSAAMDAFENASAPQFAKQINRLTRGNSYQSEI